ncbi:hypothetical protein ABZ845_13075 [Streptomyces sp. NPDC047022]|uniref:hypothetical protein n=1 Tax=Streptomyces sp. NPDC047022 TaxID=3155737 RepID=UPI0033F39547
MTRGSTGNAGAQGRPGTAGRVRWGSAARSGTTPTTAAAMSAAALPAAGLVRWLEASTGDDRGATGGGWGLFCLVLFAPLVFPVLGLLHAAVFTLPAAVLARRAVRRARGAEWLWHLGFAAVAAVVWAGAVAALWDRPFIVTAGWLMGLAVLPVLGIAYVRGRAARTGRAWGFWRLWFRAGLASFVLCVLVVSGGVVASMTGSLPQYRPPVLSARQLAGEWRGDGGAVMRLGEDGRVEFTKVPVQPSPDDRGLEDFTVCDGTGSWVLDKNGHYASDGDEGPRHRDGVFVRFGGGCGHETFWTIGGTERKPGLFVLFGDADAGSLRILKRVREAGTGAVTGP